MTVTPNANDVLMGAGGAPAAKFEEPGTTWEGKIVSPPQSHQVRKFDPKNPGGGELRYFPSGDPIMGVTVDIQTTDRDVAYDDDDGVRRIYLDGRYNKEAVRNAVLSAGAKVLEVGGYLKITFTHRQDPMDKQSRKFWEVTYTPAGNAALMNDGQPLMGGDEPKGAQKVDALGIARSLIKIGVTDAQIIATTGLGADVIAGLRNEPPF